MGCGSSAAVEEDAHDATAEEGSVEFGNPLQTGGGGQTAAKKPNWKPAAEQSQEDMRRQRLLISNFDSLVQKLRAGRKEHEFVSALADIELFCKIKADDVPKNGQELLCETRDTLVKNGRRGQFWRQKAKAAFQLAMDAVPVKMSKAAAAAREKAAEALASKTGPAKKPAGKSSPKDEDEGDEEDGGGGGGDEDEE